jgi:hypothetical protein
MWLVSHSIHFIIQIFTNFCFDLRFRISFRELSVAVARSLSQPRQLMSQSSRKKMQLGAGRKIRRLRASGPPARMMREVQLQRLANSTRAKARKKKAGMATAGVMLANSALSFAGAHFYALMSCSIARTRIAAPTRR